MFGKRPEPDADWLNQIQFNVDWSTDDIAIQVDGRDIIHITDIDPESGIGAITVFAGTGEESPAMYHGVIGLKAHLVGG